MTMAREICEPMPQDPMFRARWVSSSAPRLIPVFFEIDRDFRELYGKIETLEKKIDETKTPSTDMANSAPPVNNEKIEALEKRISTLEEALLALDKKLSQVSGKKSSASLIKKKKPKGPFGLGELLYEQGKFAEAIQSYDQYRKNFPRGQRYAQATLKMGMAFQKLKMNNDAKAFYKEVIQRYPNTRVSIRAEKNLKKL
jgi:tetratricopeptide (TPR) repeat protein